MTKPSTTIGQCARWWNAGMSTADMSRESMVPEYVIHNHLPKIRARADELRAASDAIGGAHRRRDAKRPS